MKILVNVLSGIGDALMFTPALKKIKDEIPDCEIDALIMFKGVGDIYKNLPQVSQILFWDFLNKSKIDSLLFVLGLRGKYDAVINAYPSNRKEYNIINFLTAADKRIAVEYLRMDYQNLGFLNNIRVKENDLLHNVEENILLAEKLTGRKSKEIFPLQLNLTDEDLSAAENFLIDINIERNDFVIGFHPGCNTLKNHDKRRWEPEKFGLLGKKFIENNKARILIFGGPEEEYLKTQVMDVIKLNGAYKVNTKSLTQTAAVMKRCDLFITNDSSLMHIAAALQLNTIAIIGPTSPNYIRPWQTKHKIISLNLDCAPCFFYSPKPLTCSRNDVQFKCIKELSVDMVYDAAVDQIKNNSL